MEEVQRKCVVGVDEVGLKRDRSLELGCRLIELSLRRQCAANIESGRRVRIHAS